MPKRAMKTHSRAALQAIQLLGRAIKLRRGELKITAQDLADRVGVSRALVHRIETGDPGCSVGAVFECAATVSVPLFENASSDKLADELQRHARMLTLLPKAIRASKKSVFDDF